MALLVNIMEVATEALLGVAISQVGDYLSASL